MTPNPAADELYSLPLDEFTPVRDELVKRLRSEGDKDTAAEVKALRKPSLPAWAVNQLARREADSLDRLLELRDELTGTKDAREIRRLSGERRRVMSHLVERAAEILDEAGHSASATTLEAVSKTLQAGGTDEERERMARGVLDRPFEPAGFEGLGGFEAFGSVEEEPAPARPSAAAQRKAEKLASEAESAEREAGELRAKVERLESELEAATASAEKAARRAERLRSKADAALDELGS